MPTEFRQYNKTYTLGTKRWLPLFSNARRRIFAHHSILYTTKICLILNAFDYSKKNVTRSQTSFEEQEAATLEIQPLFGFK